MCLATSTAGAAGAAASAGFACSAGACWPPPHPNAITTGRTKSARIRERVRPVMGYLRRDGAILPRLAAGVNGVVWNLAPLSWVCLGPPTRPRAQPPRGLRMPPFRGLLHGRLAHPGRGGGCGRHPGARRSPGAALSTAGPLPEGAAAVLEPLPGGACPAFDRTGGSLCSIQRRTRARTPASVVPALPARGAARSRRDPRHPVALLPDRRLDALRAGRRRLADRARRGRHRRSPRARRVRRPADDPAAPAPWRGDGRGDVPAAGSSTSSAPWTRPAWRRRTTLAGLAFTTDEIRNWTAGQGALETHARTASSPRRPHRRGRRAMAHDRSPSASRLFRAGGGVGSAGPGAARHAGRCARRGHWVRVSRGGRPSPAPRRYLAARSFGGVERVPRRGTSHADRHAGRRPGGRPHRGRARNRAGVAPARRRRCSTPRSGRPTSCCITCRTRPRSCGSLAGVERGPLAAFLDAIGLEAAG